MSDRTFKIGTAGSDVRNWQQALNAQFARWRVDYPLEEDGRYGEVTRDATATILYGLGIDRRLIADGVAPKLRVKVRHRQLTRAERLRYTARAGWRRRLRAKHERSVAPPVVPILSSSWGWRRGVHDGVDLICKPNAPLLAICDGRVIDVRSGGWWGANPTGNVSKGDGIIQLECLTSAGPFKKGLHFGYGHAEQATVREGERVEAGEVIGKSGFARAWHIHFMANGGGTTKGIGDRDPMPFVRYAVGR